MSLGSGDTDGFYHLDYIRGYLNRPMFLLNGIDLRVFSMMGDRAAVSILKTLFPDWQVDQTKLRKILAALCAAIEYPADIEIESDRVPAVTVCLLEALAARAQCVEDKELIQSAMETIRMRTTTSTGTEAG